MSAMDEQKAHDVLVSKLFYAHKHTLGNLKKLKDWFKAEDRVVLRSGQMYSELISGTN